MSAPADRREAMLRAARTFPGIVWTTDRELRVDVACGGLLTRSEIDADRVVGVAVADWFGGSGRGDEVVAAHAAALRGVASDLTIAALGRDLIVRVEPLTEDGEIVGTVGVAVEPMGSVARALGDRHRAQQEAVARLGVLALAARDRDEVLAAAAAAAAEHVRADVAAVVEALPGGRGVVRAKGGSADGPAPGAPFAADTFESPPATQLLHREDPRESEVPGIVAASALVAPIQTRGRPFGVLAAWTRERYAFSDADSAFITSLANVVAAVLDQAEAESFARDALEAMPDPVVITDDDRRIVEVNTAFERLTGRTSDELRGRPTSVVSPGSDEASAERLERFRRGETLEATLRGADGTTRTVIVTGTPHFRPGLHIAVIRDVTEQRRLERELREVQKLEAVGQLAAGVAHDFNNLLVAVRGLSALVADELPAGDLRDDVEAIRAAGDRGAVIVDRLLAFARGPQLDSETVVFVPDILREIEPLLRQSLRPEIRLELSLLDAHVLVPAGDLQHALTNLVLNARDAIVGSGLISIVVALRSLVGDEATAIGVAPDSYVSISVQDGGVGMPKETLERAREPFFTTKGGGGSGLGLAMVARLAETAGGAFVLDSEPDAGTTATILLPAVAPPAIDPHDAGGAAAAPSERAANRQRVLVVDDDDLARRYAVRALQRLGYAVTAASSPASAHAEAERSRFDLAFIDVVLGEHDGRSLGDELRRIDDALAVCFVSGSADSAPETLRKPYTEAQLESFVRSALAGP